MNCKQFSKAMGDYVNRELDEGIMCRMQEHLKACPECAKLVRELEDTSLMVRLLPREATPVGFEQRLKERVATARALGTERKSLRGFWSRIAGVSDTSPVFERHLVFRPALVVLLFFAVIAMSAVFVNWGSESGPDMDWGYIEACQEQHASFASSNPLADESAVILRERARDLGESL